MTNAIAWLPLAIVGNLMSIAVVQANQKTPPTGFDAVWGVAGIALVIIGIGGSLLSALP